MAAGPPFVHLRVHTEYSLLDGLCRVEALVRAAADLGMRAVAMTDLGALYGALEFHRAARAAGIKPLLGCEVRVAAGADGRGGDTLVLLAEDARGWHSLMRLVSQAHLGGPPGHPAVDRDALAAHREGLLAISPGIAGEPGAAAARGDAAAAAHAAGGYAGILGRDRYFLAMEDHGRPAEAAANPGLREAARRAGVGLVVTQDVRYLRPEDAEAREVLRRLPAGEAAGGAGHGRGGPGEFYLKSPAEMRARFPDDEAARALTAEIAARCTVEFPAEAELHFPRFEVPADFAAGEGPPRGREFAYLRHLAREGLARRFAPAADGPPAGAAERLEYELDVIRRTGFVNYFLVVWDFVRFARAEGIPVGPGRGSGAGSLAAYALGITDIDPLRHGLVFERFLNPERVSPPDFDIDFCQDRRGEVIEYVRRRYGRDRVAHIAAFGTLGAKLALRDVGRALGSPPAECDRLARLVPDDPAITLARALAENPALRRAAEEEPDARRIFRFAAALEGLPRSLGTHAAGLVIGERPLAELVPLTRDREGQIVTQFDMKSLARVGLLKMDFLGLKTLTVLREAVDLAAASGAERPDLERLPPDDAETFALLNRGDTAGVFQVESPGMRDLLRRFSLSRFEDLVALIALYRPGPMTMIDDFVDRKNGRVKVEYDHPRLRPILEETYGIFLYQEQVQQAAHVLAGFTLGQGDLLRRAMSKKDEAEMAAQRAAFVAGCRRTRRIPRARAEAVFEHLRRFAGYGFNKSHSAAYAVLSYRTAWMKAHHPVAFLCALLSSEADNPAKRHRLIAEARELGLQVLPPDANASGARFAPAGARALRFGLCGVKHVGAEAAWALERERGRGGPFRGLFDCCERAAGPAANRKAMESLVRCGAFDFTGLPRARLAAGLDAALARGTRARRDRERGQAALPGLLGEAEPAAADAQLLPPAEPWPEAQMLADERELTGLYVSGHPLARYEWMVRPYRLDAWTAAAPDADPVAFHAAGLVTEPAAVRARADPRPAARFRLETLRGALEVAVPPEAYADAAPLLAEGALLAVGGTVRRAADGWRAELQRAGRLDELAARHTRRVRLHVAAALGQPETLERIAAALERHRGLVPVEIALEQPDGSRAVLRVGRDLTVAVTEELVRAVEALLGEEAFYAEAELPAPRGGATGESSSQTSIMR